MVGTKLLPDILREGAPLAPIDALPLPAPAGIDMLAEGSPPPGIGGPDGIG